MAGGEKLPRSKKLGESQDSPSQIVNLGRGQENHTLGCVKFLLLLLALLFWLGLHLLLLLQRDLNNPNLGHANNFGLVVPTFQDLKPLDALCTS